MKMIKTIGDFRKLTEGLDDDFNIELRVRTKLPPEVLKEMSYPYPWKTIYSEIEFDDIGYSNKGFCIGVEIKAE